MNHSSINSLVAASLEIATAHHNQGNLKAAESAYQDVLTKEPSNPTALHLLGVIALQVGQFDLAEELITRALSFQPALIEAYNNLGNVYIKKGELKSAVSQFKKSIALKPETAEVHFNLASTYKSLGQLDESERCFRQAISIKPTYAAAYQQIKMLSKSSEYDEDIKTMESLFKNSNSANFEKVQLAFGLGKAFEDLGLYDRAFEFILKGNSLKHNTLKFPVQSWQPQLLMLKQVFNNDFFKNIPSVGFTDETPIFILGMPRSGTSLVEQILASHPEVYGVGEVQTLNQSISEFFNLGDLLNQIRTVKSKTFSQIGERYITELRKKASEVKFITDKMPDNFKIIGLIKLVLPNAKIIHCRRNPIDNCLSIYKNLFPNGHSYAYEQKELGDYYNCYQQLMEHWHEVLPGFIYDIQYEDLIADQKQQTQSLLDFCNLQWDEACLKFYKSKRAVKTVSAVQIRKPIYSDSVQAWKHYEKQLAPLIETLL